MHAFEILPKILVSHHAYLTCATLLYPNIVFEYTLHRIYNIAQT